MSAFSKIVNPGLETLTVNRLSAGDHRFPDFELLADEKRSR
jgi:hypothetical protein